jgi:hypothetical protein
MDAVNWTLAIEIKFYLLMAVGAAALFRPSPVWLLGFLAAALALTWNGEHGVAIATPLLMELNYIVFMMTGCLFYQHATQLISTRALVWRSLLTVAAFSWSWSMGPQQGQFPAVTVWYYCAYLVFGVCYALRDRFRPVRVLDFRRDQLSAVLRARTVRLLRTEDPDRPGLPLRRGDADYPALHTGAGVRCTPYGGKWQQRLGRRWAAALSRDKLPAVAQT